MHWNCLYLFTCSIYGTRLKKLKAIIKSNFPNQRWYELNNLMLCTVYIESSLKQGIFFNLKCSFYQSFLSFHPFCPQMRTWFCVIPTNVLLHLSVLFLLFNCTRSKLTCRANCNAQHWIPNIIPYHIRFTIYFARHWCSVKTLLTIGAIVWLANQNTWKARAPSAGQSK
jgi:hypothetical protein